MKIKCPAGTLHEVEDAKTCPDCNTALPKPILHSLLFERGREKKKREKPAFGIGSLVDECLRRSYYRLTEEEVLDLEKLWTFSRGHAIHAFVTRTLPCAEKEIFVKKEFPNFDVIGYIDAMHEDTIYEFKTTNNIPEEPQTHHTLQAQGYFSMLPQEVKATINKIKVIYLSLQKIKSFEIPKRDIIALLEAKAAQLTHALNKKNPPAREIGWLCKYCEFYDFCFNRDKEID